MHARRGDGKTRIRYVALRPPQAGGADRSPRGERGVCRGAIAQGKRRGNNVQSGWIPNAFDIPRAETGISHDPRARERRVFTLRGDAPQHLPQFPRAAGGRLFDADPSESLFRGADDGRGRVCGIGGKRTCCRCQRRSPRQGGSTGAVSRGYGDRSDGGLRQPRRDR